MGEHEWIATFERAGKPDTYRADSLDEVMDFVGMGALSGALDAQRIDGPDGRVIDGDELLDLTRKSAQFWGGVGPAER